MRAVRKLHINSTRTEDTTNQVLGEVAQGRFTEFKMPEIVQPPAIEALSVTSAA
jgi:hypothetical protein